MLGSDAGLVIDHSTQPRRQAKPRPDLPMGSSAAVPARLHRFLLPALGWLLLAAAASAAEPVGLWKPDPASTTAMVDKLVAGMAQAVDPADKAEMRQQLPILRARLAELHDQRIPSRRPSWPRPSGRSRRWSPTTTAAIASSCASRSSTAST